MFIELMAAGGEIVMVNLNNVARIWLRDDGIVYIGFVGDKALIPVMDAYDEIKLKMAGR